MDRVHFLVSLSMSRDTLTYKSYETRGTRYSPPSTATTAIPVSSAAPRRVTSPRPSYASGPAWGSTRQSVRRTGPTRMPSSSGITAATPRSVCASTARPRSPRCARQPRHIRSTTTMSARTRHSVVATGRRAWPSRCCLPGPLRRSWSIPTPGCTRSMGGPTCAGYRPAATSPSGRRATMPGGISPGGCARAAHQARLVLRHCVLGCQSGFMVKHLFECVMRWGENLTWCQRRGDSFVHCVSGCEGKRISMRRRTKSLPVLPPPHIVWSTSLAISRRLCPETSVI